MTALKRTNEPVLIIHEIAALLGGSGTAAALLAQPDVSSAVKVVVPIAVASAVKLLGWVARHYVSPAWKVVQTEAASIGVDLPELPVVLDAAVRVIDASLTPENEAVPVEPAPPVEIDGAPVQQNEIIA